MIDIIKEDRSQLDIVYEIMLKLGQDLCEKITPIDINGKTVHGIGEYEGEIVFMICLAKHITVEDAKEMAEYAPGRIVFAEECFDDISIMANIDLILQDGKIAMKML